jgi:hypothetical protein
MPWEVIAPPGEAPNECYNRGCCLKRRNRVMVDKVRALIPID